MSLDVVEKLLNATSESNYDGSDVWLDGELMLANQYLWITPEEVGQSQPYHDPESGCVISASVRLDNREDLINQLGIHKERSKTLSDTALVLDSYVVWGTNCPEHLMGDFAFIIWDPLEHCLFMSRDRLGARDLVYCLNEKIYIAATFLGILLEHPSITPKINEMKVAKYLGLVASDDRETYYDAIYHLEPAHSLKIKKDSHHIWRYWQIDPGNEIAYKTDQDYAQHYYDLIENAVRNRLRSAYPIGISLSGGLDSSTLALMISKLLKNVDPDLSQLKSYSYTFSDLKNCDETFKINIVNQAVMKTHSIEPVMINGDLSWPAPLNNDWPIIRDYPNQDPYNYLVQSILKNAHEKGTRLLFSGFFGDDLYAGENYWLTDLLLSLRLTQAFKMINDHHSALPLQDYLFNFGLIAIIPYGLKKVYHILRNDHAPYTAWLQSSFVNRTITKNVKSFNKTDCTLRSPGKQKQYDNLFHGDYAEGVSMYQTTAHNHKIQYAFPFFDQSIIEYLLAVPTFQVSLPWKTRKILRNAMQGSLPDSINQQESKVLLHDLFERGVYEKERSKIKQLLSHASVLERGYVRQDWLDEEVEHKWKTSEGLILWLVISLELWLQKYWS